MTTELKIAERIVSAEEAASIKLSICIPTLNRGSFIGATLESIISQATEDVEIVVVDGGSTDHTEEVVRGYQRRFRALRYVKAGFQKGSANPPAPSGRGFDRDCIRAVDLARGEYCWLFTDDDLLKPGAIQRVLDATQQQYGLIIVNAEVQTCDLSEILDAAILPRDSDKIYHCAENQQLFADVGNYLSFVGGVVIRRHLWNERDKEPYVGSGFIHVGIIFQAPVTEDTLVIADPLIAIRYGNAMYLRSSRYFEIWMFIWPSLVWSFPYYSDSVRRKLCRKEPWRSKKTLFMFRAIGAFSIKEYRDWLETRLGSRWQRLVTKLVARFPGSVANLFGVMHRLAFRRSQGQLLVDLVDSPFYFGRGFKWLRLHHR